MSGYCGCDRRVTELERPCEPVHDHTTGTGREEDGRSATSLALGTPPGTSELNMPPQIQSQSPKWSMVVKDGRRLKQMQNNVNAVAGHTQPKPYNTRESVRRERKQIGIVETGDGSNIKVVKTKLVSVFAT